MTKSHLQTKGESDSWLTPLYVIEALGKFDLDPCTPDIMPWETASKRYIKSDDGLKQDWKGRVWLNPPNNRYKINAWIEKLADHKNGILLCTAALETKRFKELIYPNATGILALDHRPKFFTEQGEYHPTNANGGQTYCLVSFDEQNRISLENSGLGTMLYLRESPHSEAKQQKEIERLKEKVEDLGNQINGCRDYLMEVEQDNLNVGDAFEALGYNRSGHVYY